MYRAFRSLVASHGQERLLAYRMVLVRERTVILHPYPASHILRSSPISTGPASLIWHDLHSTQHEDARLFTQQPKLPYHTLLQVHAC
jgi:hypothetical protein